MIPLRVTARLLNGFCQNDPWSPALDGILASVVVREAIGDDAYALGMAGGMTITDPTLPLQREGDQDGHWWWACSSPVADAPMQHDVWFHRRFDVAPGIERLAEGTRRINLSAGPLKNYRMRETVITPRDRCIHWHVIGDDDEIRRLLRRVHQVGKGGSRGRGAVTEWIVTEDGADAWAARYRRPIPAEDARAIGLDGVEMQWGLRPPARMPEHQAWCVLP